MPGRAGTTPKIHFTTHVHPVAFLAHAEGMSWIDCDNSIVPLLNAGLRVTFLAPVVLRGAIYCTRVAMRTFARSAIATADQSNAGLFRSHPCGAGLP